MGKSDIASMFAKSDTSKKGKEVKKEEQVPEKKVNNICEQNMPN